MTNPSPIKRISASEPPQFTPGCWFYCPNFHVNGTGGWWRARNELAWRKAHRPCPDYPDTHWHPDQLNPPAEKPATPNSQQQQGAEHTDTEKRWREKVAASHPKPLAGGGLPSTEAQLIANRILQRGNAGKWADQTKPDTQWGAALIEEYAQRHAPQPSVGGLSANSELDIARAERQAALQQAESYRQQLIELQGEVRDTERLDWLEKSPNKLFITTFRGTRTCYIEGFSAHPTIREAIDAALLATKAKGGGS